ncbi:uncharacterized protein ACMZJ9_007455 [Mantella aurantiaca]
MNGLMTGFNLNKLNFGGLDVIESLWSYTTSSSVGFQQSEIPLALYILGNITKNAQMANLNFNVTTVERFAPLFVLVTFEAEVEHEGKSKTLELFPEQKNVLSVVDRLMTDISSEPLVSLEQNLGPLLLGCLEGVFSLMSVIYQPLSKAYKNFELFCSVSSCKDLSNNGILHLDSSTSVSLQNVDNVFPSGCYVNLLFMTYSPNIGSFNGLYDSNTMDTGSYFLVSDIKTYVMEINNRSYHAVNINMTFTCGNRTCDQTSVCVFWDFVSNAWSSQGCVTQVTNGSTKCMCGHLTSFAVLMSNSMPENPVDLTALDIITKIGLFISIVSLVICISIQVILLKHSVKMAVQYRHLVILHMSVFLLISMVSFLASSFINQSAQDELCVAFTFCSHFSFIGFFSWTLIQGLYLATRLVFVFHHATKTELVAVSVVLGYMCPVAIAVGTFLAYFPNNYQRGDACWLDSKSGASMAFNIPVAITLLINFLVLIVVVRKLLRPSISEGKSEDEESLKKMAKAVVFCIPQFGLTWAIGIPLFTIPAAQKSLVLKYIFVILNPLQGFFLLLFGCLLDKKVLDLLRKQFWKNSTPSSPGLLEYQTVLLQHSRIRLRIVCYCLMIRTWPTCQRSAEYPEPITAYIRKCTVLDPENSNTNLIILNNIYNPVYIHHYTIPSFKFGDTIDIWYIFIFRLPIDLKVIYESCNKFLDYYTVIDIYYKAKIRQYLCVNVTDIYTDCAFHSYIICICYIYTNHQSCLSYISHYITSIDYEFVIINISCKFTPIIQ